jgi:hypothetical protein
MDHVAVAPRRKALELSHLATAGRVADEGQRRKSDLVLPVAGDEHRVGDQAAVG